MSCIFYYILYLFDNRDYPRKQSKVDAINFWRQAMLASNRFHDPLGHDCREDNSGDGICAEIDFGSQPSQLDHADSCCGR
jgi:hypothetical protein